MDRQQYLREWRERNLEKGRIRTRAWYRKNKARTLARARAWELAHPARMAVFKRRWEAKHKIPCPLCSRAMDPVSRACLRCLKLYGHMCVKNPNCGVHARHKHCGLCQMPITQPVTMLRVIEYCAHCVADRARGACMEDDSRRLERAA